jgi:uncharacterized membrane protein
MSKQPTLTLIESLFGQTKDYVDNRIELFKLKMVDKTANAASAIISGLVLFIVFFIFFIVFNIGLALLIGDLIGKAYAGFLILAAVYAIAGLVIFSKRGKIFKTPVTGMIIRKFL